MQKTLPRFFGKTCSQKPEPETGEDISGLVLYLSNNILILDGSKTLFPWQDDPHMVVNGRGLHLRFSTSHVYFGILSRNHRHRSLDVQSLH